MKVTLKQKLQIIENWLDELRESEKVESLEKEIHTIPVGTSKVFLDKNNKKNDKVQIDYIVIKRSELQMLDSRMLETIYKLAIKDRK